MILLTTQLIILWLITKFFNKNLFTFWFLLFRSKKIAIAISSIILLPGTIIHELSHWLVAEILQVRTGDFDFLPKKNVELGVVLGSVKIAKSDPFRRTIIGIAPLILGIILIISIIKIFHIDIGAQFDAFNLYFYLEILLIFLITNTMFPSKQDMKDSFLFLFFILFFIMAWWWFKWQMPAWLTNIYFQITSAFYYVIFINFGFLIFSKLLLLIFEKVLKRKVMIG